MIRNHIGIVYSIKIGCFCSLVVIFTAKITEETLEMKRPCIRWCYEVIWWAKWANSEEWWQTTALTPFLDTFNTQKSSELESHSVKALLLLSVRLFGFVWRLNFLFGAFSPFIEELNRVHHPPPPSVLSTGCLLPSRTLSQITAALRCPSHMPADQRIYTLTEAQITQSDLHCCP